MLDLNKVRFVILKCPYRNMRNKLTREYFSEMMLLKKVGYEHSYPENVIVLDSTDYIADHLLIELKEPNGSYKLISSARSIDYDTLNYYHIKCTLGELLRSQKENIHHYNRYLDILKRAKNHNYKISYYSAWTTSPDYRGKSYSHIIKELFTALSIQYHQDNNVKEMLGLGANKFNCDKFFSEWGYQAVSHKGETLPPIKFPKYENALGTFIHLKNYSPDLNTITKKYRTFWDNAIIVGDEDSTSENIAI